MGEPADAWINQYRARFKCPHCGAIQGSDHEEDQFEVDCDSCGETFLALKIHRKQDIIKELKPKTRKRRKKVKK